MRYPINGTLGRVTGLATTLATLALVSAGCGQEGPTEAVEQTTGAIGSTEQQRTIGSWNGLTQMTSTGTYLLTANWDGTGKTWTPKTFSGTFDGGNHTISNVTIDVSNDFNVGF